MKNKDNLNQNINLILNYRGRSVVVEIKKFKSLVAVKQKIFDIFYPVKHNIRLFYNNRNIEHLITKPLGQIFANQSSVSLKIEDEPEKNTPFKILNRYKQSAMTNDLLDNLRKKYFNNNNNNNNNNSIGKNNESIMTIKNKLKLFKIKLYKSPNTTKNIYSKKLKNCSSFEFINVNKKYQTKKLLPPISPYVSKNKIKNNTIILYNKCNDCYINDITIYCRTCDLFICDNCSTNGKGYHLTHKEDFIELIKDSNKQNINKYKQIIFDKFKNALTHLNNIDPCYTEEDNKCNDNSIKSMNGNCDYAIILNNIKSNIFLLVDKATEINDSFKEIDLNATDEFTKQKEINDICENEVKVLQDLDVYQYTSPFQPFFILNNYEKNMSQYFQSKEGNNNDRKYIKQQIKDLFQAIENEIDDSMEEIDTILESKTNSKI